MIATKKERVILNFILGLLSVCGYKPRRSRRIVRFLDWLLQKTENFPSFLRFIYVKCDQAIP